MSFAGISIVPIGDEYGVSVTFVSSVDGSQVDSKSSSTPSTITGLREAIISLVSQFPKPVIKSYLATVPPAFPADKYYQVLQAFAFNELCPDNLSLPKSHAFAYCANLSRNKRAFILFLDFSVSARLFTAYLETTDTNGERKTTSLQEENFLVQENTFQETLKRTLKYNSSKCPLERVVVHNPPAKIALKIDTALAFFFPNIPISKTTSESISQAAATLVYAKSLLPPPHYRLAQYIVPLPVSIATASGSAVLLAPPLYRIPLDAFITLTTSKDSQTSVTVRLLLGNHSLARNNKERGIAILDGLKPMLKGQARIKVAIIVSVSNGWREAAKITVTQEDGPSKTFMFDKLFANLTDDDDEKYEIQNKRDEGYEDYSYNVIGDLPE